MLAFILTLNFKLILIYVCKLVSNIEMLEMIIMEIQTKIYRELVEKETHRQIETETETKKSRQTETE